MSSKPKTVKRKNEDNSKTVDVAKRYEKKTQVEHILLRPDSYVGGIDKIEREEWVPPMDESTNSTFTDVSEFSKFTKRVVKYCPAALKIVDEVLVNARDASVRDEGVTQIKVTIDKESGEITVWNNCTNGIPVLEHPEHKSYIPTMIFGELLTGENFQDNKAKITGGRNGYGAKLANIYSTKFDIDCTDVKNELRFRQTFTNNMSEKTEPKVTKYSTKGAYVSITFKPDYVRLGGMKGMEDDFCALIVRRVFDISACTDERVKMFLNGKMIKVRGMEKYMDYFLGPKNETKRVYMAMSNTITPAKLSVLCDEFEQEQRERGEKPKKLVFEDIKPNEMCWDVGLALSTDGFKDTSFVNGIHTHQGGTHVEYITRKIINQIKKILQSKKKDVNYNYIKENLWVFINATVINPSFGGQTKSEMTSKSSKFFFTCDIPESFVDEFDRKCKIINRVTRLAELKDTLDLAKETDGKKQRKIRGMAKLEDANWAGTDKSKECVLIITEGDSAKTMAMSGRSVIGNDRFGIFPLRGKVINPFGMSDAKLAQNEEYKNLKKIIGFQENVDYTKESNFNSLRYGKIMIMSDQDLDGFHIRVLNPNLIFRRFPSLLMREDPFLCTFITPIVIAKRGNETKRFFNLSDVEDWKNSLTPSQLRQWNVQYLKGLGTTERKDAIKYFQDFVNHNKLYVNDDPKKTEAALELGFNKTKEYADKRKEWLATYDSKDILDYSKPSFTYHEIVHKELKHFSAADNIRSIANMLDGLKPSHRKILWALRLRNAYNKTAKVSQLAGYVSEKSDYHHGEAGLAPSIIGMAQNYVGSNNVNLLTPSGQFGSRVKNGSDASQPRYLFSRLEEVTRHLYPHADDALLTYNISDSNQPIEPENYVPIIPTVLVNGCIGIGTGYSTEIPMCNPKDIINRVEKLITASFEKKTLEDALEHVKTVPLDELVPWFRGFKGTIEKSSPTSFTVKGVWERISETQIRITELPVGKGTPNYTTYKDFLESSLVDNKPKQKKKVDKESERKTTSRKKSTKSTKSDDELYFIKEYTSNTNDVWCDYTVTFPNKRALDILIKEDKVDSVMKLKSEILLTNMHLFDENNTIKKYDNLVDVVRSFYVVRLALYYRRKEFLLNELQYELDVLSAKARFLEMIIEKKLSFLNAKKAEVIEQLERFEFPKFEEKKKAVISENNEEDEEDDGRKSYNYLFKLPVIGLTSEKVEKYQQERDAKMEELVALKNKDPKTLWREDLNNLKDAIDDQNRELERSLELEASISKSGASNKKKKIIKKK